jgi:hypothetical protein
MNARKNWNLFRWLSIELFNGYYLSFLSIGLLLVILRNDITPDLKQALFFILMVLIAGTMRFFIRAASKEDKLSQEELTTLEAETNAYITEGVYYLKDEKSK